MLTYSNIDLFETNGAHILFPHCIPQGLKFLELELSLRLLVQIL